MNNEEVTFGLEFLEALTTGKDLSKWTNAWEKERLDWELKFSWLADFKEYFNSNIIDNELKYKFLLIIKNDINEHKDIEHLHNYLFPDFHEDAYEILETIDKDFLLHFIGLIYPKGKDIAMCHYLFLHSFKILEKELNLDCGKIKEFLDAFGDVNCNTIPVQEIKTKPKLRIVR